MPVPDPPESIGEVSRRLDRFEASVIGDFAEERAARAAIAAVTVPAGVYAAERTSDRAEVTVVAERVRALESRISWAWRTALTALVFPVIVAVIALIVRGAG